MAAKKAASKKKTAPKKKAKKKAKKVAPPKKAAQKSSSRAAMSPAIKMWRTWIDRALKRKPHNPLAPLEVAVLAYGRDGYVAFYSVGDGFSAKKLAKGESITLDPGGGAGYIMRERAAVTLPKRHHLPLDAESLRALAEAMKTLASYQAIAAGKVKGLTFASELTLLHGRWTGAYPTANDYRVAFLGEAVLGNDLLSATTPST